jgi:UDP-GlcNAc:undecaprenyl-phosphate GlcNAc-1-phosphate transferase
MMPYASDVMILAIYMGVVSFVFVFLYVAERSGWHVREDDDEAPLVEVIESATKSSGFLAIPFGVVLYGISAFLIAGAFISTSIPVDFTLAATGLLALLVLRLIMGPRVWFLPLRLLSYVTVVFVVYLLNTYQPAFLSGFDPITYMFFGALVMAIALSVRLEEVRAFNVTPMDYLIALVVLGIAVLEKGDIVDAGMMAIALKAIIMFYGCEVILTRMESRWNIFTVSVLASLFIISVRGAMLNFM